MRRTFGAKEHRPRRKRDRPPHSKALLALDQRLNHPSPLCYRDSGLMKTDRQLGSGTQHSSKPTLGVPRGLRRASVPRPPTPADFLIANLELECTSSHRKRSPLRIPNRKFSRVFDSDSALNLSSLVTHHSSLATALLIHGSAIKSPANPQGFNNVRFSNRR